MRKCLIVNIVDSRQCAYLCVGRIGPYRPFSNVKRNASILEVSGFPQAVRMRALNSRILDIQLKLLEFICDAPLRHDWERRDSANLKFPQGIGASDGPHTLGQGKKPWGTGVAIGIQRQFSI
jgi:hypothetical protein